VPAWTAFAVVAGLVLCVVLILAVSTASAVDTGADHEPSGQDGSASGSKPPEAVSDREWVDHSTRRERTGTELAALSTTALLVNVLATHGFFAAILLGAAVLAGIPWSAFGIGATAASVGPWTIALGFVLGLGLYVADEALARALDAADVDTSESLRQALEPESRTGWVFLLLVVLPIVAGFEELLFRAVLIGVLPTGFPLPAAGMVILSTIAFALGHGLQGPGGILVTGLLGGVLGVAFLLSGSLLLVVVAHYLVNALELVVHQGLDVDRT
jgi:membrane protease YdiL (CAAX protease family)